MEEKEEKENLQTKDLNGNGKGKGKITSNGIKSRVQPPYFL